ncbi:hypothetical protein [Prosthecobacter sp.]|uniref:hypothetical protein n=1 Tax=Prosthecobacter sp. TaxID=1965333 RepID=UPI001D6B2EEC|nr:hypothetical protein [Prosthecobacter sp.]MCB1277033.1 hypothetical protein [Prosthecobacter sp.]
MNLLPWQSTALALLGFTAGLALHLRWHPLRRHLSDAWDFLRLRPVLIVWTAGALILASVFSESLRTPIPLARLTDWREMILPLSRDAAQHMAMLPHVLIPPWPLACLVPVLLVFLTVRIWRWPYRYGERRPGPEQKVALLVFTLTGFGWLALEGSSLRHMLPEGAETVKLGLRYVFTALAAAGVQVWLVRFVMAWEKPQDTEAETDATAALEHVFARWQGVAWLAGFNLLWMGLRFWQISTPGSIGGWLWIEVLLLFAALPVAVGAVPGTFWLQGAAALRILLRSAVPLVLLSITSLAVLILAQYTSATTVALSEGSAIGRMIVLPLNALALAMLDCWLLLTALLLMLRHGFPRSPSA